MSIGYRAVQWNRQKRRYDAALVVAVFLALAAFVGVSLRVRPQLTVETLAIRGTALAAFGLLTFILCIGPLARIDRRFLPLLYNRRHLGVTMFLLAATHATAAVVQFHAGGDLDPLVSVFTAYRRGYGAFLAGPVGLTRFPFEPLGAAALVVLFVMAATSHDFWLRNLGPSLWKTLHLGVLLAYGLLLGHVAYGVLQTERSPVYVAALAGCGALVFGLHVAASAREVARDRGRDRAARDGFVEVGPTSRLEEGRGAVVVAGGLRVAVFLRDGRAYAVSNVCRHQGGPVGEGRIVDGCITCPWHGWQYRAEDGCSPPPFEERIETYRLRVIDGSVWIDPRPCPAGTPQPGAAVGRTP